MINAQVFAVAGLCEWWKSPARQELEPFAIVKTDANAAVAPLHDRMPVIMLPERYAAWSDPAKPDVFALQSYIGPYPPDEMRACPMTTWVNGVKNDDRALIEASRAL